MARQFKLKEATLSLPSVSSDAVMMAMNGMCLLRRWHRNSLCHARSALVGISRRSLCPHLVQVEATAEDFAVAGGGEEIRRKEVITRPFGVGPGPWALGSMTGSAAGS